MEPRTDVTGKAFERRVAHFFSLLGFHVTPDVLVSGRQVDLLIESNTGVLATQYIVECKDQARPVTCAQYDAFQGRLSAAKNEIHPGIRGIMVSSVGFVKEIKSQSQSHGIDLLTIAELETSLIDFRPYVRTLVDTLEREPVLEYFVEPQLVPEHLSIPSPAFHVLEQWLVHPELNQLTLLGDFGTGKTTLLRKYALDLGRRYEEQVVRGGGRGRLPLFIDLRDYTHAISLRQIVLDLLDSHRIRAASYATFEYLSQEGQLLIILDGFDEMVTRGNYEVTLQNFRELNKIALGRAKMILSCRTHYFATGEEVRKFVGRRGSPHGALRFTDLYREIALKPNFLITYLRDFEQEQVDEYLRMRCGAEAERVRGFISQTFNLPELSRRPVLLDMIVSSEQALAGRAPQSVPAASEITAGVLYQVYTDTWLARNDWSTVLEVEDKAELLEQFAFAAESQSEFRLERSTLPKLVGSWKRDLDENTVEAVDRELRTASFLVREGESRYRFSHRSFQDFFLARYLLRQVKMGAGAAWARGFFRTEVYRFIIDLLAGVPSEVDQLVAWIVSSSEPLVCRANAIKCLSRTNSGAVADAMLSVLQGTEQSRLRQVAATALGGQSGQEVIRALIAAVADEDNRFVRSNAFLALGRTGADEAAQFCITVLSGQDRRVHLDNLNLRTVYMAAIGVQNEALIKALIRHAPITSPRNALPGVCLELCERHWCSEAERYCVNVVRANPRSARIVGRAFGLLSVERRRELFEFAKDLIDEHCRVGGARAGQYIEDLIKGLKGIGNVEVRNLLEKLIDEAPYYSEVALELLAEEFPDAVLVRAKDWMQPAYRRSHRFRGLVIRKYASLGASDSVDIVTNKLSEDERPAVKLELLDLLYHHFPSEMRRSVLRMWSSERTTSVKVRAVELLMKIDADAAERIVLDMGLSDPREGTRASMHVLLGALHSSSVTEALLHSLEKDRSKFVRLRALRALVTPGREVSRERIQRASMAERDPAVLALRREFLGE